MYLKDNLFRFFILHQNSTTNQALLLKEADYWVGQKINYCHHHLINHILIDLLHNPINIGICHTELVSVSML